MKKLTLALAAATALISVPALAADLGVRPMAKAPAYVAPVAFANWNGFYIGAQIGYQWGNVGAGVFDRFDNEIFGFGDFGLNANGVVGGVHAGFNFQTGAIVWGIEGDFEGSGVDGSRATPLVCGVCGHDFDTRWQGSVRGRLGFAAGNALFYVTGGVAFANLRHQYFSGLFTESFSETRTGWTIGVGTEWMFSPNWTARLEYRYADFGHVTNDVTAFDFGGGLGLVDVRNDFQTHTVRLGVSYKFGGPGPVMASY
jgi:outer membrane immunogenic protein